MPQDIESEELLASEKSDTYVIPNPDSTGQFLVVPGTVGVPENGKKIWIRNLSGKPVEVTFFSPIGGGNPVSIANGKARAFPLPPAPVGVYPYTVEVLVNGGRVRAQGGSDPRILYG
jgi:hypothetical protein